MTHISREDVEVGQWLLVESSQVSRRGLKLDGYAVQSIGVHHLGDIEV